MRIQVSVTKHPTPSMMPGPKILVPPDSSTKDMVPVKPKMPMTRNGMMKSKKGRELMMERKVNLFLFGLMERAMVSSLSRIFFSSSSSFIMSNPRVIDILLRLGRHGITFRENDGEIDVFPCKTPLFFKTKDRREPVDGC